MLRPGDVYVKSEKPYAISAADPAAPPPDSTDPRSTPRDWPPRPGSFPELLTPVEAAQYLRLDELGSHSPTTAVRTLNYWRDRGQLRATKYARHVWFRKAELDRFLAVKTEA